jgi:LacI family transcriptional regulator
VVDEPRRASATIRDVAARAGVALSSVSRVLAGHADVSAAMRERVERAARELGYQPDLLAQSLRRGSTRTIGFALRDISNPLFAHIAQCCEQELRRAGYAMLLTNSGADPEVETANLVVLRQRRVDGLIVSLVSETNPATQAALAAMQMPIVLLDREVEGLTAGAILCDHYAGVRRAVEELLARGHRRIAMVTGSTDVRSTRERRRAYEAAFDMAGLAVDPNLLKCGDFGDEYAKVEVAKLLGRSPRPTAVIAGGVTSTAGALRAMRQLRLTPGTDVAFVALDEWPFFDLYKPSLASVSRDPVEMGMAAARLLLDMMDQAEPRAVTIDTVFTPRDSIPSAPSKASTGSR